MILCITNRKLCKEPFLERIEKIAKMQPGAIILREKDMEEERYRTLLLECKHICKKYNVVLIANSRIKLARECAVEGIHLPFARFMEQEGRDLSYFNKVGVSVHSVDEAMASEKKGASYLIAGHVFSTDCKKDLPPRGLTYLEEICKAVSMPVYGVGGIKPENSSLILKTGSAGVCIMSDLMQCCSPEARWKEYQDSIYGCI